MFASRARIIRSFQTKYLLDYVENSHNFLKHSAMLQFQIYNTTKKIHNEQERNERDLKCRKRKNLK